MSVELRPKMSTNSPASALLGFVYSLIGIFVAVLLSTTTVMAGASEDCETASRWTDWAEVLRLCRPLVEQGNTGTQTTLGYMYRTGEGVAQDYATAMAWYRKAAEQGDSLGQAWVGGMYEMGEGVAQDYVEAAKWYRKGPSRAT